MPTSPSWSGHIFELIPPRTIKVSGPGSAEFSLPRLAQITVTRELVTANSPFFDCVPNLNRRASHNSWGIPNSMPPESLRLYRLDGDRELTLERDVDYRLDNPTFGGIKFIPSGTITEQTYMDYNIKNQRIDVIAVNAAGEIRLFCGKEALAEARIPLLAPEWHGICRIMLNHDDNLTGADLYPLADRNHSRLINYEKVSMLESRMPDDWFGASAEKDPDADQEFSGRLDYRPAAAYSPAMKDTLISRLAAAKDFTLVYFGDSVTMGGDVEKDRRWTKRLNDWLRVQYPNVKFSCPNSAIGGTNSSYGRERFVTDVLQYRPDAVTVMFPLNDNGMDDATCLANHRYFVSELRKINAIPIFMTSNLMTASWMHGFDHTTDRLRQFCAEEQIILIDVCRLWENLRVCGIPYEALLANGINHPNYLAAGMFFEALRRLFSPDRQ